MNQYQDLVDGVTARLQAQGNTAEAIVKDGDPRKIIVKEAQEWGADLIYGIAYLWSNKTDNTGKR